MNPGGAGGHSTAVAGAVRASLGRDHSEDSITLAEALKLLSLPRELGAGDDGETIVANIGRFGPYVKHGSEFRSLDASDDVYTIALERAKELLAQPKKSMRRARQAPKELKNLGKHPDSGADVKILDGRYGPYVTDGETNASVPKGTQVDAVTMAAAIELLNARLADAIDMYNQTKQAHWTVKGPDFYQLHELFDKVAEAIEEGVDEIAERAVELGGVVDGTVQGVAKRTTLKPYPVDTKSGRDHLTRLSKALAAYGKNLRAAIQTCWRTSAVSL